jgi:hypothetical protein
VKCSKSKKAAKTVKTNHYNHQSIDMSRIGKSPISLYQAEFLSKYPAANVVKVKGPKGELFQAVDPDIAVKIDNSNYR